MKKSKNKKLSKCKECFKDYNGVDIKRSYGEYISVYILGFCSAFRYTNYNNSIGV